MGRIAGCLLPSHLLQDPTSGSTQMTGKLGCGPRPGAPPADKTQEVGKTLRAHRETPLPPTVGAAGDHSLSASTRLLLLPVGLAL